MRRPGLVALTVSLLLTVGCAEGSLTVDPEDTDSRADAGADADFSDTADTEQTGDATDVSDTDAADCCTPGDVECTGDEEYIECIADDDGCGHWTDPLTCPSQTVCDPAIDAGDPCEDVCTDDHPDHGEPCSVGDGVCQEDGTYTCDGDHLVCDAEPGDPEPRQCDGRDNNCDGEIDSDGICGPCEDDQFAPDNHSSTDAAALPAGTTHDDLTLCDNEDAGSNTDNWFYLGELTSYEVELEWEEVHGPLGLDIWTADSAGITPDWHNDAGTDPSKLSVAESLGSSTAVWARVFFRVDEDDKPPAGTPYSIAHLD